MAHSLLLRISDRFPGPHFPQNRLIDSPDYFGRQGAGLSGFYDVIENLPFAARCGHSNANLFLDDADTLDDRRAFVQQFHNLLVDSVDLAPVLLQVRFGCRLRDHGAYTNGNQERSIQQSALSHISSPAFQAGDWVRAAI
jgi:hypothetical protein